MADLRPILALLLALSFTLGQLEHLLEPDGIDNNPSSQLESIRSKRIVLGNRTLPVRPLPVGNLSNSQGEAICHYIDNLPNQRQASFADARRYCRDQRMKLLFIENEEEHEYLYYFMSSREDTETFKKKSDFPSEEAYTAYVYENIGPGLLVRCVSICGNLRPTSEGRVLDYEDREFVGLAIKVQWKTGQVRWYPAGNLEIGGFISRQPIRQTNAPLEDTIFEPGDRVRIKSTIASDRNDIRLGVPVGQIGIIADVDFIGRNALAFFPSNRGWRGPLVHLEITDKRKAIGTFWTSGKWIQNQLTWLNTDKNVDFSNWAADEPNQRTRGERCVQIKYHKDAKWFTASCAQRNYFICKADA